MQTLTPHQLRLIELRLSEPSLTTKKIAKKFGLAKSTIHNTLAAAYLKLDIEFSITDSRQRRKEKIQEAYKYYKKWAHGDETTSSTDLVESEGD